MTQRKLIDSFAETENYVLCLTNVTQSSKENTYLLPEIIFFSGCTKLLFIIQNVLDF